MATDDLTAELQRIGAAVDVSRVEVLDHVAAMEARLERMEVALSGLKDVTGHTLENCAAHRVREEEHTRRIAELEGEARQAAHWRHWSRGGLAVLGVIVAVLGTAVVRLLVH